MSCNSAGNGNTPFPTCLKHLFQSDAKCKDIGLKMISYSYANKTNLIIFFPFLFQQLMGITLNGPNGPTAVQLVEMVRKHG